MANGQDGNDSTYSFYFYFFRLLVSILKLACLFYPSFFGSSFNFVFIVHVYFKFLGFCSYLLECRGGGGSSFDWWLWDCDDSLGGRRGKRKRRGEDSYGWQHDRMGLDCIGSI
jgi:hypothetical protein